MSKSASLMPCKLPRRFLTECISLPWSSSVSSAANPTVVCRRFGDNCLRAERLLGDAFLDTDLVDSTGFCVYGVCIDGALKDRRGLARFGVEPFCDECESDDAKDALAMFSIAVLVIPCVLLVVLGAPCSV